MFQKTTLILLLLTIVSCKKSDETENDKIKVANWILGNWENKSPDGNLTENWEKANEAFYKWEALEYGDDSELSDDDRMVWVEGYLQALRDAE